MKIFNKNKNKESEKLPMNGKIKRSFRFYLAVIATFTLLTSMSVTAFVAAGDPITVVNNLSDFIFVLFRAISLILLILFFVVVMVSTCDSFSNVNFHLRTQNKRANLQ